MTDYIKKSANPDKFIEIKNKIEKITGKVKISYRFENGELIELSVNDKKLSESKKKELQEYVDTLKE